MSALLTDGEYARRAAALSERMEVELPSAWRPDLRAESHPEQLLGALVTERVVHGKGYSGGPCTVVVIREHDGRAWNGWLWHQVLRDEWEAQHLPLGALVLIRYLGKGEPKDGRQGAHRYRLEVDRGDPPELPSPNGRQPRHRESSATNAAMRS
jgi:hypothetical protein